jgi:hypothetical protein
MAASKSDVLDMVNEYGLTNKRPIPKRDVVAKYGDDGATHLKALVEEGTLGCRRGRNGGYFIKGEATPAIIEDAPIEADNAPSSDESNEIDMDSIAERFRALEARMAAENAAESSDSDEQLPF